MKKLKLLLIAVLAFLMPLMPANAFADATTFDPLPINVKVQGAGVPVGTVVAWPVTGNPSDAANWLECKGQTITQSAYPELYAVVGNKVPDYRGMFLRGGGGAAGNVGEKQEQGVYIDPAKAKIKVGGKITGVPPGGVTTDKSLDGDHGYKERSISRSSYVITTGYSTNYTGYSGALYQDIDDPLAYANNGDMTAGLPVELSVSGNANETRPVNVAVRYLIRAKP